MFGMVVLVIGSLYLYPALILVFDYYNLSIKGICYSRLLRLVIEEPRTFTFSKRVHSVSMYYSMFMSIQ